MSNAVIARIAGDDAWRWMLGVAAIPSLIYALMCFGLPESPRWLIGRKGDRIEGLRVLKLIEPALPEDRLNAHADEIMAAAAFEKITASHFLELTPTLPYFPCVHDCVLQPAFGNQRGALLRPAYF